MNTRSRSHRFPVLQDAQTTSHSRNTALLRGLARVYHLRLGQFSRDERIADGVLCKLGDWEDMVETDPEIMACVFEAQKVIMEATLARPTWDTLRADIAALHLPRYASAGSLSVAAWLAAHPQCGFGMQVQAPPRVAPTHALRSAALAPTAQARRAPAPL